jgi:hypothetical protein
VDRCRVDGGEVVHQRPAEIEVGAVRLLGDRSQVPAALATRLGLRVDRPSRRLGELALLRDLRDPYSQVLDGPLDRLF